MVVGWTVLVHRTQCRKSNAPNTNSNCQFSRVQSLHVDAAACCGRWGAGHVARFAVKVVPVAVTLAFITKII